MNRLFTVSAFCLIVLMLVLAPSLRSFYQQQSAPPADSILVTAPPQDTAEPVLDFVLEQRLKKKHEEDGYIIETYQEYEVYKDENGKVTKEVPTATRTYLRYKLKQ